MPLNKLLKLQAFHAQLTQQVNHVHARMLQTLPPKHGTGIATAQNQATT